jgi:hypothetical protein
MVHGALEELVYRTTGSAVRSNPTVPLFGALWAHFSVPFMIQSRNISTVPYIRPSTVFGIYSGVSPPTTHFLLSGVMIRDESILNLLLGRDLALRKANAK